MVTISAKRATVVTLFGALSILAVACGAYAAGAPVAPASAKEAAPIDLTGDWVSLVTVDWRWRMVTPARGDYQSVPINETAYQLALKWDPAKDEAAGEQCKSYGAAALMAVPGRLRISWPDENMLQVQTDAGMQTRLLRFASESALADAPAGWQGQSVAVWSATPATADPFAAGGNNEAELLGTALQGRPVARASQARRSGSLKVVTTNLLPGYLRKNGIPYSAQTRLTEYWDLVRQRNGNLLLVVTSIVHDPVYLRQDWITALHFEKESDGSKWDPQPCSAR